MGCQHQTHGTCTGICCCATVGLSYGEIYVKIGQPAPNTRIHVRRFAKKHNCQQSQAPLSLMVMAMAATRRPLALARHVGFTLDEAAVEHDDAAVLDAAALVAHVPAAAAATAAPRSSGHGGAHRVPVLVPVLVPQRVTLADALLRGSVDLNKSRLMMGMMVMMIADAVPRVCAVVVLRLQTL